MRVAAFLRSSGLKLVGFGVFTTLGLTILYMQLIYYYTVAYIQFKVYYTLSTGSELVYIQEPNFDAISLTANITPDSRLKPILGATLTVARVLMCKSRLTCGAAK